MEIRDQRRHFRNWGVNNWGEEICGIKGWGSGKEELQRPIIDRVFLWDREEHSNAYKNQAMKYL